MRAQFWFINRNYGVNKLAFDFCCFSVAIRFFIPATTANDLWFRRISIPDFIHYIFFPIFIRRRQNIRLDQWSVKSKILWKKWGCFKIVPTICTYLLNLHKFDFVTSKKANMEWKNWTRISSTKDDHQVIIHVHLLIYYMSKFLVLIILLLSFSDFDNK